MFEVGLLGDGFVVFGVFGLLVVRFADLQGFCFYDCADCCLGVLNDVGL